MDKRSVPGEHLDLREFSANPSRDALANYIACSKPALPTGDENPMAEPFDTELLTAVRELLPGGGQVLVVGCADARPLVPLLRAGAFDVTVMDSSPAVLDQARSIFRAATVDAVLVQGDVLQPGPAEYDLVFNLGRLEHSSAQRQIEFLRGLGSRSRGYVLALLPNQACPWYWLSRIHAARTEGRPAMNEVPGANLSALLTAAGLNYVGQSFLAESWTQQIIEAVDGLDPALREELLAIYRTSLLAPSQKAYLVGALAHVAVPDSPPPARWTPPTEDAIPAMSELSASIADAVALALNAQTQRTQLEAQVSTYAAQAAALHQRLEAELAAHSETTNTLQSELTATLAHLANREREVAALSDQLNAAKRELANLQSSKWWKAASSYWTLRHAALGMARRVVPLSTRRWLHPRLRGLRERSARLNPNHARTAAIQTAATGHVVPPAQGLDIICLPIINWDFRFQRPQQLLTRAARAGQRVFYVRIEFSDLRGETATVHPLEERIFELTLPGNPATVIYHDELSATARAQALAALQSVIRDFDVAEAVVLVHYPFWQPLAQALRELYGWKIVYDCMDDHTGFGTHSDRTISAEERLMHDSDLITVPSRALLEKTRAFNPRSLLVPNAGDYAHFSALPARESSPIAHLPRPVIGYYGAIAEWFDAEAVRHAADRHPDWSFVLIGHTFGSNLGDLARRPNVHLLGEKPYAELPAYLTAFDVATIPFLITPLIRATHPVKVFEYLAAGKPVVASEMPELADLSDVVLQYTSPDDFVTVLERALASDSLALAEERRAVARANTWEQRQTAFQAEIDALYGKAAIIIVSYNALEHLQACIDSILANTHYPNYEIIIVDNASEERVRAYLRQLAAREPRVRVTFNDRNLGFAAANNIGVAQANDSEFLVLLNNDTVVPPGWLSRLLRYARRPEIGLIGPVTNWTGNEARIDVDYANIADMPAFARRQIAAHPGQHFDVQVAAMFCVAFRREVFERVGPLDERFGQGMFEDDDYARRVRQAGYRVVCAEDVFVHHFGMASFSKLGQKEYQALFERNRRLYEDKWGEPWTPHHYRSS